MVCSSRKSNSSFATLRRARVCNSTSRRFIRPSFRGTYMADILHGFGESPPQCTQDRRPNFSSDYLDVKPIHTSPVTGASRVSGPVFSARYNPNACVVYRTTSIMTLRTKRTPTAETCPLCLHVYRVGGIWGDDKIVRADDRKTPKYYLKGTRLAASWQFALHAGGQHGVLVCHVKSPYVGPPLLGTDPSPIIIIMGPERHTVEVYRGNGSSDGTYSFKGLDNDEYRWRPSSRLWGNRIECLNSQDQVVATYRITFFAISKDGELRIHQPAWSMADLLVATCLAMRMPDH